MNAVLFKTHVPGQSWTHQSVILPVGVNPSWSLSPDHIVDQEAIVLHPTSLQKTVDYPYGRLRTDATFGLEVTKRGFRSTFQTVNPKTGRLNAVKKSTYDPIRVMFTGSDGHVSYYTFSLNGGEELNKGLQFLANFSDLFTTDQLIQISIEAVMMFKVHVHAITVYCGADPKKVMEVVTPSLKAAVQCAKGNFDFLAALIDLEALEALKVPDFKPFRSSEPVSIMSLRG